MKNILLIALLAISITTIYSDDSCDVAGPARIDCGFSGMNPNDCIAKGCCWEPASV